MAAQLQVLEMSQGSEARYTAGERDGDALHLDARQLGRRGEERLEFSLRWWLGSD